MKKKYDYAMACYLTASTFTDQRAKISDTIHAVLLLLAIAAFILALTSCVDSITIRGQYADYTVTPRKPVTIKAEK
jgi:hypothetical protein